MLDDEQCCGWLSSCDCKARISVSAQRSDPGHSSALSKLLMLMLLMLGTVQGKGPCQVIRTVVAPRPDILTSPLKPNKHESFINHVLAKSTANLM